MMNFEIDYSFFMWQNCNYHYTQCPESIPPKLHQLYYKIGGIGLFHGFSLYMQDRDENTARLPLTQDIDCSLNKHIVEVDDDIILSVIVVTRNDLHVERMKERTQAFIDGIIYQSDRIRKKVELLIVEWNPPEDRLPLAEEYIFPAATEYLTIRIVTVSQDLHTLFDYADRLPLYQMIAKNVGVRRARGRFIACTNIDILFSNELFDEITSDNICKGNVYRSNRWDVDRTILDLPTVKQMIEKARDYCFQINYATKTTKYNSSEHTLLQLKKHIIKGASNKTTFIPMLNTNGCGDFQMLHRDDWYKIGAYSEIDAFSWHIDSLFAFTCHYAGLSEITFEDKAAHYHIDHTLAKIVDSQSSYTVKNERLENMSLASLSVMNGLMSNYKTNIQFNYTHWGMAGYRLPDQIITHAAWENDIGVQYLDTIAFPCKKADRVKITDMPVLSAELLEVWIKKRAGHIINYLTETITDNRALYLWGASLRGAGYLTLLQNQKCEISGFVDNDKGKIGKTHCGITIWAPETLDPKKQFVLIASMYQDEIANQLSAMGWIEGENFIRLY